MDKATKGTWFPNVTKTGESIRSEVYTDKNLNRLANLGVWHDDSRIEGISNAVLMASARKMYDYLVLVSKNGDGIPSWLIEDINYLLKEMDKHVVILEKTYENHVPR